MFEALNNFIHLFRADVDDCAGLGHMKVSGSDGNSKIVGRRLVRRAMTCHQKASSVGKPAYPNGLPPHMGKVSINAVVASDLGLLFRSHLATDRYAPRSPCDGVDYRYLAAQFVWRYPVSLAGSAAIYRSAYY